MEIPALTGGSHTLRRDWKCTSLNLGYEAGFRSQNKKNPPEDHLGRDSSRKITTVVLLHLCVQDFSFVPSLAEERLSVRPDTGLGGELSNRW